LVETILASFQLHEILWELKDHSAGLNCGRWDYIFSFIKKFRNHARSYYARPFAGNDDGSFYAGLHTAGDKNLSPAWRACIGGMAAQIPIKNDPQANEAAIGKSKSR
jgi:malate synthase